MVRCLLDPKVRDKDTFEFLVQGSAPEPYVVSFRRHDVGNFAAYCAFVAIA